MRAKAQLLTPAAAPPTDPVFRALNGFRRSATDRWFGGLCGGLAKATGIDSWLWRLAFVLMLFLGGTGLIAYIILWIFVPLENTPPYLPSP